MKRLPPSKWWEYCSSLFFLGKPQVCATAATFLRFSWITFDLFYKRYPNSHPRSRLVKIYHNYRMSHVFKCLYTLVATFPSTTTFPVSATFPTSTTSCAATMFPASTTFIASTTLSLLQPPLSLPCRTATRTRSLDYTQASFPMARLTFPNCSFRFLITQRERM